ncbi:MAG: competence protein ComEC family protein [Burkholderiales bacterium]|nr:competence protein ComEC family protein [Burkholderiales bacterium]
MQDRIFYLSSIGFILGVLLRSFIFVNLNLVILFGIISFGIILFYYFISKNSFIIFWGIFMLTFSFGIFRFGMADISMPDVKYVESSFVGNVIDDPTITENNQKLVVEIFINKIKTKILVITNLDLDFKYGDGLSIKGKLEKPENFMTDQGKEFDYVNYLRKDGIFYIVKYPEVEIDSHNNGNFIKSILFSVKDKFLDKMNLSIREPESLLMGGLILGEKSAFDESLRQSFVNTGTIHIVALSGYNVTIVAEWIMKMLASFPKNIGLGAGIFSILLFVLMTGGSSTAVRAGIMAGLALFARLIGRNYDVSRALILAGVIMVLVNPFILVFDVSFQLSFIATVAVIFYTPKIEKYFLWVTPRFKLRDIVSVTVACYVFVLPFILYKMGNLSLVALPANILILPFIPPTMLLGFLTGLSGFVSYAFSVPFGFVSQLLLHYELSIISFFSNLPFAAISIPNFPLVFVLVIYIYFVYLLFWRITLQSFFKNNL